MTHCPQHDEFDITNLAPVPPIKKLRCEMYAIGNYSLASRYLLFRNTDNYYDYEHKHTLIMVCTACGLSRPALDYGDQVIEMGRIEEQARAIRDTFARALKSLPLPISREIMELLFFAQPPKYFYKKIAPPRKAHPPTRRCDSS
jgi:hypothetical protein